jgi:hypothetical protein
MSTKPITFNLISEEYRMLVLLCGVGGFVHQVSGTKEQADAAFNLLHTMQQQLTQGGVKVLGSDGRLEESIDMAIAREVSLFSKDVRERPNFWKNFDMY